MFKALREPFVCILAAFVLSSLSQAAKGDLVLNLIGELNWDRSTDPLGPAAVLFGLTSNDDAPNANELNAFNVGLRILPAAGASGVISIQSVGIPSSNSVFPSYATIPILSSVGDVQTVSADNAAFANVSIPSSGRNLFQANFFSPTDDAIGKFEIYADRETTNYFTTTEFDGAKFQNVPTFGDVKGAYLGSFTVSVSSVPEPNTLLCWLMSLSTARGLRYRKRR